MKSLIQTFLAGVVGALTVTVLIGATGSLGLSDTGIQFPDGTVQTTAAGADPRRVFYLTTSGHDGNETLTACAPGFHMASLWETLDVSNLRYATDSEGNFDVRRRQDGGDGPPSGLVGWVRTGFTPTEGVSRIGEANCGAWASDSVDDSGTLVHLDSSWDGVHTPPPVDWLGPWNTGLATCDLDFLSVWCVQDSVAG